MRYSVEQCGCHLGIAKDRHPLPELQIGCDDDAGLLIKLTDEVEQQRPAGFREGALEIPCHFCKLKKRNDTCEKNLILM